MNYKKKANQKTTQKVSTQVLLKQFCNELSNLLIYKNGKYGDSALSPDKIFSKLEAEDSIKIRLDDKLSRIKNSNTLKKNDIIDLIGYLTLLSISNGWTDLNDLKD
jgi:hypothetical protein